MTPPLLSLGGGRWSLGAWDCTVVVPTGTPSLLCGCGRRRGASGSGHVALLLGSEEGRHGPVHEDALVVVRGARVEGPGQGAAELPHLHLEVALRTTPG